jgi:hypothetical protein
MFRDYTYQGIPAGPSSVWIVDDDFKELVGCGVMFWENFTRLYERKGLPVAPNLVRLIVYYAKTFKYQASYVVEMNERYNKRWHLYAEEVAKYLVLL